MVFVFFIAATTTEAATETAPTTAPTTATTTAPAKRSTNSKDLMTVSANGSNRKNDFYIKSQTVKSTNQQKCSRAHSFGLIIEIHRANNIYITSSIEDVIQFE